MQNPIWQVRVRAEENEKATVAVRKHTFEAGLPLHFNERYEHFTALEYVLGAIGADVVNGLRKPLNTFEIATQKMAALAEAAGGCAKRLDDWKTPPTAGLPWRSAD